MSDTSKGKVYSVCTCIEGKERKKLFLSPEGQHHHQQQHVDSADDVDSANNSIISSSSSNSLLNEVLAVSLGLSNDCPGMLPEQKVPYLQPCSACC